MAAAGLDTFMRDGNTWTPSSRSGDRYTIMARAVFILLVLAASFDVFALDGKYTNATAAIVRSVLLHFGI